MKQIQKLNEIAASNTTKTLEPVHIMPADQGSAEDMLGFAAEEMAALAEVMAKKNRQALDAALIEAELYPPEQSPESLQQDQLVASVGSTRVAVIPAVDQPADHQPNRGPVDVIIGNTHVKNPA
jgi:hypothetical protein